MDVATAVETAPIPEQPEAKSPEQLFKYSTWVHIGPGAEDCEDGLTGACTNTLHFHAWLRLPNQFQHDEIRKKALAAKARRVRQLRDPETDVHAILEDELDQIARGGDASRKAVVDELIERDWWRDYILATKEVADVKGDDDELRYANLEDDQRRFRALRAMDPDERPHDEYDELDRHLDGYAKAVEAKVAELQAPARMALEQLDINALLDKLRDLRIDTQSVDEFMSTYSVHAMFVGTRVKEHSGEQRFASMEAMRDASPEVIDGLREALADLEKTAEEGVGKGS